MTLQLPLASISVPVYMACMGAARYELRLKRAIGKPGVSIALEQLALPTCVRPHCPVYALCVPCVCPVCALCMPCVCPVCLLMLVCS